jgi:subtilase family serine protease
MMDKNHSCNGLPMYLLAPIVCGHARFATLQRAQLANVIRVTAPLVHSISYGDDENSLDVDYMNRINVEFQKAGVRGLSLLFSSGDNGVNSGDETTASCTTRQHFVPSFPATSPFVTAVVCGTTRKQAID